MQALAHDILERRPVIELLAHRLGVRPQDRASVHCRRWACSRAAA